VPTVLRWKGYRFFFYSADGNEPVHIHVVKGDCEAKVWLSDGAVAINLGFNARDLREIVRKTGEQRAAFLEAWNDHFADRG
jgi:Domain of unknown function (DUF4160)